MKPSERIAELQRELIRARLAQRRTSAEIFMLKVAGMTDAELAQGLMTNTDVMIAAILAYLDERLGA